ncbi:MAG: hypothetical protein J5J00_09025 [Deltaproteobacteria bacterium]|nr:hypothetical protein [Deltaproteobacteria bacterium]
MRVLLICVSFIAIAPAYAQDLTTERVSISSAGEQGSDSSSGPSLSSDGTLVAFSSTAPNLVTGDGNTRGDVFVHNRSDGSTSRVSVSSAGVEGDQSASN